jgi:ectoine hydroxylase-related dioxygenase (phytanoyl-CoA dioxygenase family)
LTLAGSAERVANLQVMSLNVDVSIDATAATLLDRGYVIVERLAPELTERVLDELRTDIDAAPVGHTDFLGERTKRIGGLLHRSVTARELALHPVVLGLADIVLQPHCSRYQLNYSGIMHLLPGAKAQELHRDGDLYPFRHPCPPMLMPTMWALTDFTAENGGTMLVPGSHRWDQERDPMVTEIIAAVMPAGSLLVYLGGTIHGGGTNLSDADRTGLAFQYSLGWLRQEENQYLTNPPEIARTFPERLQRLIGYDYGAPYLGFVDGDSPQRLLQEPHDGPRNRTSPEVDALSARMHRHRWGSIDPEPTPPATGPTVPVSRGLLATNDPT